MKKMEKRMKERMVNSRKWNRQIRFDKEPAVLVTYLFIHRGIFKIWTRIESFEYVTRHTGISLSDRKVLRMTVDSRRCNILIVGAYHRR